MSDDCAHLLSLVRSYRGKVHRCPPGHARADYIGDAQKAALWGTEPSKKRNSRGGRVATRIAAEQARRRKLEARRLSAQGMDRNEIAAVMNVSPDTVSRYLREN